MTQGQIEKTQYIKNIKHIVHELETSCRHNPHAILGIHPLDGSSKVIRLYRPGAERIQIELFGNIVPMHRVHESGLFELTVPSDTTMYDYRIFHTGGLLAHDPYVFWPTISDVDEYLFNKGTHYEAYKKLGGRLGVHQDVSGVSFAVWAPSALSVCLVGFKFLGSKCSSANVKSYSYVVRVYFC